jgi:hypothetical protein
LAWWLGFGIVNIAASRSAHRAVRSFRPESTALDWTVSIITMVAARIIYRVIAVKVGCRDMPMWPEKSAE